MASFRQIQKCTSEYGSLEKTIKERTSEYGSLEKKQMVKLIDLVLGKECPKHVLMQFFTLSREKKEIAKILYDIRTVLTRQFQPSEAFWHPSGCQCQDDDCLASKAFWHLNGRQCQTNPENCQCQTHPENCQCIRCRIIMLLQCCCECFTAFDNPHYN